MQVLEIKIQCGCGSRFAFEVQPVHGRMPSPVFCPRCGCEHTQEANAHIARLLAPPLLHGGRRGLKILNLPGYNYPEPEPDSDQMLVSIPQPGIQTLPVGGKTNHTTELDIPITDNSSAAPHLADAVAAAIASSNVPIIPGGAQAQTAEAAAASSPAAPAPGGLRVRPSRKAQTTTVIHPPVPPVEDVTPVLKRKPAAAAPVYDDDPPQGVIGWLKASGKVIASTAIGFLVVLKFIGKLKLAKLLAIFGIGSAGTSDLGTTEWNFDYLDNSQMYVQVDDSQRVVDTCIAFWSSQGKTFEVKETGAISVSEKNFFVTPVHEGYAAVLGPIDWDPKQMQTLAQQLSSEFGSTVMTFTESDFSGAHYFAVYQAGQKSFSHHYDVQIKGKEAVESVKVEGEEWVKQNGYFDPDDNGFEDFTFEHINLISQKLGLKWWTFSEEGKNFHELSEKGQQN